MESNISTVAFRSNLYPVEKSFYEDSTFRSKNFDYPEKPLKYKHIRRISD